MTQVARRDKIFRAAVDMVQKLGPPSLEVCLVGSMADAAASEALWAALEAKGIITEAEREHYLDVGVDRALRRFYERAGLVYIGN